MTVFPDPLPPVIQGLKGASGNRASPDLLSYVSAWDTQGQR